MDKPPVKSGSVAEMVLTTESLVADLPEPPAAPAAAGGDMGGMGLASGFSSSNAIMGVRKTTDFLEKATWGLAIFMVVMSVATAYVVPSSSAAKDVLLEQAQKEQQTNPYNMPTGTAAPQTDATAPAESAPATEAPATETPAPVAE